MQSDAKEDGVVGIIILQLQENLADRSKCAIKLSLISNSSTVTPREAISKIILQLDDDIAQLFSMTCNLADGIEYSSSTCSIFIFMKLLSELRRLGWSVITSNAFLDNAQHSMKTFYLEKLHVPHSGAASNPVQATSSVGMARSNTGGFSFAPRNSILRKNSTKPDVDLSHPLEVETSVPRQHESVANVPLSPIVPLSATVTTTATAADLPVAPPPQTPEEKPPAQTVPKVLGPHPRYNFTLSKSDVLLSNSKSAPAAATLAPQPTPQPAPQPTPMEDSAQPAVPVPIGQPERENSRTSINAIRFRSPPPPPPISKTGSAIVESSAPPSATNDSQLSSDPPIQSSSASAVDPPKLSSIISKFEESPSQKSISKPEDISLSRPALTSSGSISTFLRNSTSPSNVPGNRNSFPLSTSSVNSQPNTSASATSQTSAPVSTSSLAPTAAPPQASEPTASETSEDQPSESDTEQSDFSYDRLGPSAAANSDSFDFSSPISSKGLRPTGINIGRELEPRRVVSTAELAKKKEAETVAQQHEDKKAAHYSMLGGTFVNRGSPFMRGGGGGRFGGRGPTKL